MATINGFERGNGTTDKYNYEALENKPTIPAVDATLATTGAAADAKKTGDEIADLKSAISGIEGLSADVKQAFLDCFKHVAWIDDDGHDSYDALEELLFPPAALSSITAVFDSSRIVYAWETLNSLKNNLTVTALYENGYSETVLDYTLAGSMEAGNNTMTVSYGGKTATFTVIVYGFTFTKGYLNGKPTGATNIVIKSNTNRILADSPAGVTPFKYENGTASSFYGVPIGSNEKYNFDESLVGYRVVVSISEWDDENSDYHEIYNTGWGAITSSVVSNGVTINANYINKGYFIAMSISGSTGSEDMSNVDTSNWSIVLGK